MKIAFIMHQGVITCSYIFLSLSRMSDLDCFKNHSQKVLAKVVLT